MQMIIPENALTRPVCKAPEEVNNGDGFSVYKFCLCGKDRLSRTVFSQVPCLECKLRIWPDCKELSST